MQKLEKFGTKCKTLCIIAVLSLFTLGSFAQSIVKGIVKDETGEGVMGATVKVEGTNDGAVTDMNGNFSVNPGPKGSLLVSYVGYVTQRVNVKGKSNVEITLQTDEQSLNELVVVGYGVQKKSDLTGAVASVKEADLQNRSTTDAAAALQGKVSGVQILNSSGAPGEGAQIRVRGYSSNSGSLGPLLIVDGLKVDNIQYLDPSMIESMEVLKDAASAAIYGAEAGNGVILITTKSGKKGTSSITYDVKFVNQRLGKVAELLEGDDYVAYEKYIGSGKFTDQALASAGYQPGTNYGWVDQTFEDSWAVQHSLTFQGGNDKGHFLAGLNYVKNDGIVVGDRDVYKRFTAQINADYQIKKWLKVGTNNSIEKWETKSISQRGYGSALNSAMSLDPLTPAYCTLSELGSSAQAAVAEGKYVPMTADGLYYATSKYIEEATGNPLWQVNRTDAKNGGWTLRGSSFLDFNPIEGLVFTSRIGYRISHSTSHSYSAPYYLSPLASNVNYDISAGANTGWYYQWENFINYNKTFAEKHNFGVMAGMSWTENNWDNVSTSANGGDIMQGYESNYRYIDYVKQDVKKSGSNAPGVSRNISYFGRLSYNYNNTYFFQANFRADAYDSSKLSKQQRWGYFPSFSAGWTVSNEKFFKDNVDTDVVSFLKLRASWGRNGNVNVLNNYQYSSSVRLNSQWYQYTDNVQTYGTAPEDKLANPDLKWETSQQIDLGLEARFLSNRLTFNLDWYKKNTKDLILGYTPVPEVGFKSSYMNAGDVLNTGFEFELGWKDNINDFVYSVNANLSTLKNEVKKLNYMCPILYGTKGGVSGLNFKNYTAVQEGHPLWYFTGFDYVGVNKETGAPIYRNAAGEEVPTVLDGDLKEIGSAIPDITYGITINLAYKGFDFTLYGTGAAGCDIFSLLHSADRIETNTFATYWKDSWKQAGDNAKYPDMKAVASDWYFWSSTASMFSGNYFKFKQIQLGYTLPKTIVKKACIENLRLYVSLDDFFTITNYPGCDPETALGYGSAGLMDSGYDSGVYPTSKKIVFGLNLTF